MFYEGMKDGKKFFDRHAKSEFIVTKTRNKLKLLKSPKTTSKLAETSSNHP